jgi:hypothetical protein
MIPLKKIKKIGITWHHCDITSENTPVCASFLDNTAALACLPFAMLDTSQIQEIQRVKNIIRCISLENMGHTQVDVRQKPTGRVVQWS